MKVCFLFRNPTHLPRNLEPRCKLIHNPSHLIMSMGVWVCLLRLCCSTCHAFFHGYNATVLVYGQIGSGKTYTMGTNYDGNSNNGIIPRVMQAIFKRIEETKGTTEFLIRVPFSEIYKEEVIDLLDSSPDYLKAGGKGNLIVPSRVPIQIRENDNGGISFSGVTEAEVTFQDEMASFLMRGSVSPVTGSTNMNSQSRFVPLPYLNKAVAFVVSDTIFLKLCSTNLSIFL